MIKVSNIDVYNIENAMRGLRNPMNSWVKNDTVEHTYSNAKNGLYFDEKKHNVCGYIGSDARLVTIGPNDLELAQRMIKAGSPNDKFMRQIFVSMDICGPLYYWKEADTYKVGTVADSCSTIHKIHAKEFTMDDFSHEHLLDCTLNEVIKRLNHYREMFLQQSNKDTYDPDYADAKTCWWQMIQLLPSSYNQLRTWTANYAVLRNIYIWRRNHKLDEWRELCKIIETLPYAKELICYGVETDG